MERQTNIRVMVRGVYDLQKMRIQTGNRITGNFKHKLGQKPSQSEADLEKESKDILKQLRLSYDRITDGIADGLPTQRKFKSDGLIDSYTELCLLDMYFGYEYNEKKAFRQLEQALKEHEIYTEFLSKVKGVGPAMAGVIISEIDIRKARYASSLHQYAGLSVGPDGKGMSRRKEHLVESTYIDRDGNEKTKLGITFNPFLKTKLTGVLGPSFLKCKSPYSKSYYDYKSRLENHPEHKDKTKLHIHNMANRYQIKLFLNDLYAKWRALECLEVHPPYHEAKLGIFHKGIPSQEM